MVGKSTLKRDIAATFGSNLFGALVSIGSAAILARVLGPANRGLLGLVMLIPIIVGTFCILGQDMVNATFAGLYKDKRSNLFQQSLIVTVFGTIVSVLVICAFYFWLPVERGRFDELGTDIVWLSLLVAPFLLLSRMLIALLRGVGRVTDAAVVHAVQNVTRLGLLAVFLAWLGHGLKAAIVVTALNPVVAIAMSVWLLRDYITLRPSVFSGEHFRKSLGFGAKISLTTFVSFLVYRLDQGILGYMVSTEEIGFYVVAVGLAERLRLLPSSISSAFLPRLANDISNRQSQVPMVFRCTVIISAISMLLMGILGVPGMVLIFGWAFLPSIPPFLLLLPGIAFLGGAAIIASDLAAREKPQYGIWTGCITLIVNIIFVFILIPLMGIAGAALASSISYIGACIMWLFFYHRESGVSIGEMIPRLSDLVYLYGVSMKSVKQLSRAIFRSSAAVEAFEADGD